MLNLDTHILIRVVEDALTPYESRVIRRQQCGISAIVLWEIEKLYGCRRIRFGLDNPLLVETLRAVYIWPITPEVCLALRSLDFRSDPADELIAATSLAYRVPLLTRDEKIRASKLLKFV